MNNKSSGIVIRVNQIVTPVTPHHAENKWNGILSLYESVIASFISGQRSLSTHIKV